MVFIFQKAAKQARYDIQFGDCMSELPDLSCIIPKVSVSRAPSPVPSSIPCLLTSSSSSTSEDHDKLGAKVLSFCDPSKVSKIPSKNRDQKLNAGSHGKDEDKGNGKLSYAIDAEVIDIGYKKVVSDEEKQPINSLHANLPNPHEPIVIFNTDDPSQEITKESKTENQHIDNSPSSIASRSVKFPNIDVNSLNTKVNLSYSSEESTLKDECSPSMKHKSPSHRLIKLSPILCSKLKAYKMDKESDKGSSVADSVKELRELGCNRAALHDLSPQKVQLHKKQRYMTRDIELVLKYEVILIPSVLSLYFCS